MRKSNRTKLVLNRETLHHLRPDELHRAVGGAGGDFTTDPTIFTGTKNSVTCYFTCQGCPTQFFPCTSVIIKV